VPQTHPFSIRRLAPEALLIGAGQGTAALGSIASVRVLTSLLRPSAFGEFALALTGATLAQQLILGPVATASVRYYAPAAESRTLGTYVRATIALFLIGSLILLGLSILLGACFLLAGHRQMLHSLHVAFLFAWVSSASSILDGIQNAARQRAIVAMHQGSGAWLRLALVIVAARAFGASSTGILWAYSAGYALLMASQAFFLFRTLRRAGSLARSGSARPLLASMCRYAWPFSTWGIFTWLQSASDRWALGAYRGLHQAGLYQSLYQIGYYPAAMLTQFLLQVCMPVVFERAGAGGDAKRQRVAERFNNTLTGIVLCATLLGAALSYCGGHRLLALLLAPDYRSQSALITPLILASGCFSAGQIASLNCMTSFSTHRLIAPKVVTAMAGMGLNVWGAVYSGTSGVAAAQVIFSVTYLWWILRLNRRNVLPAFAPMRTREA
jgi:O-antigen/teichoic acid export membrane protein